MRSTADVFLVAKSRSWVPVEECVIFFFKEGCRNDLIRYPFPGSFYSLLWVSGFDFQDRGGWKFNYSIGIGLCTRTVKPQSRKFLFGSTRGQRLHEASERSTIGILTFHDLIRVSKVIVPLHTLIPKRGVSPSLGRLAPTPYLRLYSRVIPFRVISRTTAQGLCTKRPPRSTRSCA